MNPEPDVQKRKMSNPGLDIFQNIFQKYDSQFLEAQDSASVYIKRHILRA